MQNIRHNIFKIIKFLYEFIIDLNFFYFIMWKLFHTAINMDFVMYLTVFENSECILWLLS